MTAVDMCALHPAELLTITGSKGWMDLCTTQVALGFTKQCAAFFEKCAVPEGTTASGVDPWSGAPMCSEFGGELLHDLKVQLYDCDPAADPFDLMPRHEEAAGGGTKEEEAWSPAPPSPPSPPPPPSPSPAPASTPRAKSKKRHPDAAAADPVTEAAAAAHAGVPEPAAAAAAAAVEPAADARRDAEIDEVEAAGAEAIAAMVLTEAEKAEADRMCAARFAPARPPPPPL